MKKFIMRRDGVLKEIKDWPQLTFEEMLDWLRQMDGYGNYEYGQIAKMLTLLQTENTALRSQLNELL